MYYTDSKFGIKRIRKRIREDLIEGIIIDEIKAKRCISEDTKQRKEIQLVIKKMHKEGKNKEEILKKLMFLTAVRGYNSNFIQYYETWIENQIGKIKSEEENER